MANYFSSHISSSIVLILSVFLLLQLNKVDSLKETVSFDFSSFHPSQGNSNLILQGDAQIDYSSETLDLTKEPTRHQPVYGSVGRVLYPTPIHLWDWTTDTVASFQTNFTFVIDSFTKGKSAEGLVFFLAPVDTQPQHSAGGFLGIFSNNQTINDDILAVEFDTFTDPEWDPEGPHIGIDVNSIKSTKTTPFDLIADTDLADAYVSINYDAHTYVLTVSFGYIWHPGYDRTLELEVNLRQYLPEWVRVGLSATTGDNPDLVETHRVKQWSFYSEYWYYYNSEKSFKNTNLLSNYVPQA